jgi:hypothetical protein
MRRLRSATRQRLCNKDVVLAVSVAVASTVSLLSGVPERFPLGQEIGIILSQLGFAYAGAWIFDLIVNELPRRQGYRNVYSATWADLSQVANNADMLVGDLQLMTSCTLDAAIPPAIEDIHDDSKDGGDGVGDNEDARIHRLLLPIFEQLYGRIEFGDFDSGGGIENVGQVVNARLDIHRKHYNRLAPYLLTYEPRVIAAIGSINTKFSPSI